MTSHIGLGKAVLSRIAGARSALRVAAKGAFLLMLALMIVSYAHSVSQSAPVAPEPLPPYIYS